MGVPYFMDFITWIQLSRFRLISQMFLQSVVSFLLFSSSGSYNGISGPNTKTAMQAQWQFNVTGCSSSLLSRVVREGSPGKSITFYGAIVLNV